MGISIRDVTVIVPTRSRKERVGTLLSNLKHPHDLITVVVDESRRDLDLPNNLNGHVVVTCPDDAGAAKAMEAGIVAAKTSHVLCLGDDLTLDDNCIEEAIKFYNYNFGGQHGVVGLNQQVERDAWLGCFALMSKQFYMKHCHPTPYKRFYQDTEWTCKAKALGVFGICESAKVTHPWEPHHEEDLAAEFPIFNSRMAEFRADLAKQRNVFIGVPVFNGVDVHFFDSMMKFVQAKGELQCKIAVVAGDSLVARARNVLTMEFLRSDCTHLLFIDSDLIFSADHVARLLSHDEDIVGGFYPKKQQGRAELVFNTLIPPAPMDERRLTPVRYIGTGFICVKRRVFEKMIEEMGDQLIFEVDGQKGKTGFDFWPVGVYKYKDGTSRYLSEDWYFCQRAIDLGFKVYGDNAILLKHSGAAVYPLATQEQELFGRLPVNGPSRDAAARADSPLVAAAA